VESEELSGGTTAVCIYFRKQSNGYNIHCSNVGDSRAVLFGRDCSIILPLSCDQNTERSDEVDRIEQAGGHLFYVHHSMRVNGILEVTRSIGDSALDNYVISKPEISSTPLYAKQRRKSSITNNVNTINNGILTRQISDSTSTADTEFIVLATDGLWGRLNNEDVARIIQQLKQQNPQQNLKAYAISEALASAAIERGSPDNICVLVICVQELLKLYQQTTNNNTKSSRSNSISNNSTNHHDDHHTSYIASTDTSNNNSPVLTAQTHDDITIPGHIHHQ